MFRGAGVVGAAGLLAACGDPTESDPTTSAAPGSTTPDATTPDATTPTDTATATPTDTAPAGETTAAAPPEGAIATSEIPVGGGTIYSSENVVVTQPTAGSFKAFDATCTHQQCQVSRVDSGRITCTCHGSQFSIADGSVVTGPATRALAAKTVTVSGDSLVVS